MMKVTKDTVIIDILKANPKANEVFIKYNMGSIVEGKGCAGCLLAETETIEEACKVHEVNLKAVLEDLNKLIGSS